MAKNETYRLVQSGDFEYIPENECRIIIVGKTGTGKSTLGNKLVGRPNALCADVQGNAGEDDHAQHGFGVARWFDTSTKKSQFQTGMGKVGRNHVTLKVVDTPGLFDPSEDIKYTMVEVARSLSLCCPGEPHAILFVIRCDTRSIEEEGNAFDAIIQLFGDRVKDYLIVVFTHGEVLKNTPIETLLSSSEAKTLNKITKIVGNRYVVFSNTPGRQDTEVNHLLEMINKVSISCTRHYTNETLKQRKEKIEKEITKLIKSNGLSHNQAILEVRKTIVESDEKNEFFTEMVKVFGMVITLVGITGCLAFTVDERNRLHVGIGGVALLSVVFWIRRKFNKLKKADDKCTIL